MRDFLIDYERRFVTWNSCKRNVLTIFVRSIPTLNVLFTVIRIYFGLVHIVIISFERFQHVVCIAALSIGPILKEALPRHIEC